jgi:hypothetical protein
MLRWLMDGSGTYGDSERCEVDTDEDAVLATEGDIIRLSGVEWLDEDDDTLLRSGADNEKAARSDVGEAVVSSGITRNLRVQPSLEKELDGNMPSSPNLIRRAPESPSWRWSRRSSR